MMFQFLKKNLFTIAVLLSLPVLKIYAQTPGINFSYMDSSANPREDFYNFCNGKWQKNFVLPGSDARYGSFNEINENNLKKIKLILDAASKNKAAAPNTDAQRLRDFYNTATDSLKLNELGFIPILAQLSQIDKVSTLDEFLVLKSDFDLIGVDLLFGSSVSPNLKNSKRNSFTISQGGLGLGDRDYYFSRNYEEIRGEYKQYITKLFILINTLPQTAEEYSEIVLRFETRLADKAMTRVELRDVEKQYNIHSSKALEELTPHIKWADFFTQKKMLQPDTAIVGMVEYMKNLDWILSKAPLENLKIYAKARLLMDAAPYLSRQFLKTHFNFRGTVLSGTKEMKPNWQRAQNTMNATIGDIVSQEFVKKYFTPEAKLKVNKLIDNLILAYRERIASRDWMSAEAKKQANQKLDLLIRKVGYPTKWKNYTGLKIGTESYWANVCAANKFLVLDNLSELKKPVDRNKWQMTPVTVNAYYDPTTNEITFPAAILQPPFFDPKAEDAANYGTMGSIIGHELTHGFDDQGSRFDAKGNMKMWWTETDLQNFKSRTKLIVEQFNSYKALDTLHVNGSMTQGENIADLGGLTMAYYAYKKSLAGTKSKTIKGFTGEQRFFIAWAQGWKSKVRDEELKRLLTVDYHSPAYFRAFAPLSNMKEFYEAFKVVPGDKMYVAPEKRVEIW
jgi:putative endopeptidase